MSKLATVREIAAYQARQFLNFSRGPMRRVFASGGGHGSVFLKDALSLTLCKVHVRPDITFDTEMTLDDFPSKAHVEEFRGKTGFHMDDSRTINENMVSYLGYVHDQKAIVLLSRMSRLGNFFTRNGLSEPICLLRHPLHAYISFVGHRHPKAGDHLGGLDSEARIHWYANQWNAMTSDYLDSGSKILRFEFMHDDVKGVTNPNLSYLLRNWRTDKRNNNILDEAKVNLLHDLVKETYFRVYDDWSI